MKAFYNNMAMLIRNDTGLPRGPGGFLDGLGDGDWSSLPSRGSERRPVSVSD